MFFLMFIMMARLVVAFMLTKSKSCYKYEYNTYNSQNCFHLSVKLNPQLFQLNHESC